MLTFFDQFCSITPSTLLRKLCFLSHHLHNKKRANKTSKKKRKIQNHNPSVLFLLFKNSSIYFACDASAIKLVVVIRNYWIFWMISLVLKLNRSPTLILPLLIIKLCLHLPPTMSTSEFPKSVAGFGYGFNYGYWYIILHILHINFKSPLILSSGSRETAQDRSRNRSDNRHSVRVQHQRQRRKEPTTLRGAGRSAQRACLPAPAGRGTAEDPHSKPFARRSSHVCVLESTGFQKLHEAACLDQREWSC